MSLTTQVHSQDFQRDAARFAVASGRTVAEVLRSVAKSAVQDVVKLTPPSSGFNPAESFAVQKRKGESVLTGELASAFKPIEDLSVLEAPRNPDLAASLTKALRRGDGEDVRAILSASGIVEVPANKLIREATPAAHARLRNRRGKIPPQRRRHPFYVMRRTSVSKLVRERRRNVGTAKAGWAAAALSLGVRLPRWITRHPRQGRVRDESKRFNDPSITLTNTVNYVGALDRDARFTAYAQRNAHRKLVRQLDAKMRGLWGRR